MRFTRRILGLLVLGTGAYLFALPVARLLAQETPNRREFTVTIRDYRFSPARVEVSQDDLVKLTVRSEDVAYSMTIDEYRVAKRVPPGGAVTFELRTDRAGTFPFYSNLTNDARHTGARGELVVRSR